MPYYLRFLNCNDSILCLNYKYKYRISLYSELAMKYLQNDIKIYHNFRYKNIFFSFEP